MRYLQNSFESGVVDVIKGDGEQKIVPFWNT